MPVLSKFQTTTGECDQCTYKVTSGHSEINRSLFCHFLRDHSQLSAELTCDECNKAVWIKKHLSSHIAQRHMGVDAAQPTVCDDCSNGKEYVKHSLFEHFLSRHSRIAVTFACAECDSTAQAKRALVNHISRQHMRTLRSCRCGTCGAEFDSCQGVNHHKKTEHTSWSICEECGRKFDSKHHLAQHAAYGHRAATKDVRECDDCGVQLTSSGNGFRRHIVSNHLIPDINEQMVCDDCRKPSPGRPELFQHYLRMHAHAAPAWQCDQCPYKGKVKDKLIVHIQCHHRPRPRLRLQCDRCPAVYNTLQRMNHHKKVTHENKRVVCEDCGRILKNKSSLMKSHRCASAAQTI